MANLQPYFIREKVIQSTRNFFIDQGFHEVITPTCNNSLPIEPNIYPFTSQWTARNETKNLYLSTSPESGLKKMIAMGIGDCFAFGKCFRNLEGSGSLHLPEFLMLEWYRADATYSHIMQDVKDLILHLTKYTPQLTYQNKTISLDGDWPTFSMVDLFKKYTGLDMEEILNDKTLYQKAQEKGYSTEGALWSELFDQIFCNEIEPQLPLTPFFINDFPARLSPLCNVQNNKPYLADRFEFFMFGMELANGNNENTDYEAVRKHFIEERKKRIEKQMLVPPLDEEFINALKVMHDSGKNYAGIGMGIDRLAMILADVERIEEIELLHV